MEQNQSNQKTNILLAIVAAVTIIGACALVAFLNTNTVDESSIPDTPQISDTSSDSEEEEISKEDAAKYDSNTTKITTGGVHEITGSHSSVIVDTAEEVTLNLTDTTITSDGGPAIYIANAKSANIILNGTNNITTKTDEPLDGAIFSNVDLTLSGEGSLIINSNEHAIISETTVTINGGTYNLKAGGDGIHGDGMVVINGGTFDINSEESIEATYVKINDGTINIYAIDDGINASDKSDDYSIIFEMNGGSVSIEMADGDTDAIDSNGDLIVTGGTINIKAQSAFDYDGTSKYTGGTIIINGETVNKISNQMMGGPRK